MEKSSTWFLRLVLILLGLIALALAIFVPTIFQGATAEFPGAEIWFYLLVGGLYFSVAPFMLALYQAWKLLNLIDYNQAFSKFSVSALHIIKICALTMSFCFAMGVPFLFHVAELDDAPGLGLLALVFCCAPLVVATFAKVLERLFLSAINYKSENDLTV